MSLYLHIILIIRVVKVVIEICNLELALVSLNIRDLSDRHPIQSQSHPPRILGVNSPLLSNPTHSFSVGFGCVN